MIEFIYLFLFRVLSGGQNAFGYTEKKAGLAISSGVMLLFIGGLFALLPLAFGWLKIAAIGWLVVSFVGTIGVWDNFSGIVKLFPKDVHLWELLATSGVLLSWVAIGGNLIYIFASIYPSLLIHKGLINIGSGLKFWDTRTDDRTGKTYNIPLLGIKVPRMGIRTRISIAVLSALAVIINATSLQWVITFQDLIAWI